MKRKVPETSLEANDAKTFESKNRDFDRIIAALKVIGPANYDQIASHLKLSDPVAVARRMKELRDMGILFNTGRKSLTRRGRNAFVHCLSHYLPENYTEVRKENPIVVKPTGASPSTNFIQLLLL